MSSESSSSKQFGLYRTIDARTEEFLKLSRKRQMRQGCLCAAISTAITVTVVICIVLIYEYTTLSNTNSYKSNWLGLMNETIDIPFDTSALNKAKLNFDHSTIELLPILLKTFKRNKYYDQFIDDTSSPNYETTEYSRNIFADSRNWMKMPSRVYAIEYKTSPVIYLKSPTRNVDYYTKIRKIRDYKRIMNYVDKMISEKVTGSTQSLMKRDYSAYEKPLLNEDTTPMPNFKKTKPYTVAKPVPQKKTRMNCNCSTKMGELLRKIISSLQSMLPDFMNNNTEIKPCSLKEVKHVTESYTVGLVTPFTEKRNLIPRNSNSDTTTTPPVQKIITKHETTIEKSYEPSSSEEIINSNAKRESNLNNIIQLIKPKNHKSQVVKNSTYYGKEKLQSYYNLDNVLPISNTTNKPLNHTDIKPTVKSIARYIFDRNKLDDNSFRVLPNFRPILNDNRKGNGEATTNIANLFDILDANSLELVKMFSGRSNKNSNISVITKTNNTQSESEESKQTITTATNSSFSSPRKVNNIVATITHALNKLTENVTGTNINKILENDSVVLKTITNRTIPLSKTVYTIADTVQNSQPVNLPKGSGNNKANNDYNIEDSTLEEEMEKASDEDSDEENTIRNLEQVLRTFKNDTANLRARNRTAESSEMYQWELVKIEEHAKNLTDSIMSQNRPTYLEIQRNDWNINDNLEDDNNINNYAFD